MSTTRLKCDWLLCHRLLSGCSSKLRPIKTSKNCSVCCSGICSRAALFSSQCVCRGLFGSPHFEQTSWMLFRVSLSHPVALHLSFIERQSPPTAEMGKSSTHGIEPQPASFPIVFAVHAFPPHIVAEAPEVTNALGVFLCPWRFESCVENPVDEVEGLQLFPPRM